MAGEPSFSETRLRAAILLHRYLGIAIGLVVSLWCLSAFVMMYVQYPEFTDSERVAGLDELDVAGCCVSVGHGTSTVAGKVLADGTSLDRFRLEMLAGRLVLRVWGSEPQLVLDLATGDRLNDLGPDEARQVAEAFAERVGIRASIDSLGPIERDQWTVYASYHPHRPLYRYAANDAAATEWYVSQPSGEVVQITTARERFWNWIGAVTHWVYFTSFRQFTFVWSQTVLGLTIVATLSTVLGVYIGVKRLRRRRSGRVSPYRGFGLWHHWTGLVFGVLVLTWLVSGFLSMNPWGALEGRSFATERERLRGRALTTGDITAVLDSLASHAPPAGTVRLDSTLVDGRLSLLAWDARGRRRLLDSRFLKPIGLSDEVFETAGIRMRPDVTIASSEWIESDDAYYFSHHEALPLPVYRIGYADGERFYLDAVSGALVRAVDAERQWYRWLFEALHRGDFARVTRMRPVWDAFMLPLLFGVTLVALTGTWMGIRRLTR